MIDRIKVALAAAGAWVEGNPRKAALAAFGVGFVVKWIV